MIFKKWLFKIAILSYVILFCASPTFAAYNAQSQIINSTDSLSGLSSVKKQYKVEENLIRNDLETSSESVSSSGIHINEVMFNPAEGENARIELKNSGIDLQNISGWGLTDENGYLYKLPQNLPDVPVGNFIIGIQDRKGSTSKHTGFYSGEMTIQSKPGIVNFLDTSVGQTALNELSEFIYLPIVMGSDSEKPSHWESFTSPVTNGLNVISMVSPSEGWIAGDGGVILHWNGTSWTIQNNGTQGSLRALSMVSSTNGWAGGITNTLLHYNGTTWSPVTLPNNSSIWSIGMLSASDGWLFGQDPSSLNPVPYRWNGSQWIKQTSSPTWPLSRLAIIDPNNIWGSVGALNCAPNCDDFVGSYSHWNGTTWASTPLTHRAIWGLMMLDANNGWMTGIQKDIGSGTLHSLIMKWDGTTWSDISHPDSFSLNGVAANSNTYALAVGYNGSILQWDGNSWASMVSPTTNELRDVAIISSTEAWAIGASGTILHYTP